MLRQSNLNWSLQTVLSRSFWTKATSTLIPVTALAAAAVMIASAQPPQGKGKGAPPPAKGDAKADAKGKAAAPPAAPVIVGLRPDYYEVTGLGGNTSVKITKDGLIVADTKNLGDANYTALMNVIRTVSQLPVKYAIVTHVHQDHSGNTGSFIAAGAKVIANEGEKKELATYTMPAAGRVAEPGLTYPAGKTYKFKLGDTRVEVHNYGPAHTGGDSVVYFPDDRIVHSGDVVVGVVPNCDYPNGGSVANWPKVLDKILKLDFQTLIPGHGDPMTKEQVKEYKKKWDTFIARAVAEVKKGTPKDKLLAAIKVDDIGWTTTSFQPAARLDPFYAEMQQLAKK